MNERTVMPSAPAKAEKPVHLSREQYRKIKAMSRDELEDYLQRVFYRGYDAGIRSPSMSRM